MLNCSPYGTTAADVVLQKLQEQQAGTVTAAQQNGIDSEDTAIQVFMASDTAARLKVANCSKAGLYGRWFHPNCLYIHCHWLSILQDFRVLDLAVWCCCGAIRCFETQCWI